MRQANLPDIETSTAARTQESRIFETMWRALPRHGLTPHRSSFRPERAGRLLSNIVLLEISPGAAADGSDMTTCVRLVGGALRDLAGLNVTGMDYLDLVPDRAYQAQFLMTCLTRPCAAWSLAPVVYDRGYSSLIEITQFPLLEDVGGQYLQLVLMVEIKSNLPLRNNTGRPVELRPAVNKAFIDIGAGMPENQGI